jgi:uncharacterized membrane protein YeaQ/YmgE (transglycosylase-associated protein family)
MSTDIYEKARQHEQLADFVFGEGETMMNFIMWLTAGGALGWIAYSMLDMNEGRGLIVSAIIGALAALFGGNVLAPLFATPLPTSDLSGSALTVACLSAMASLKVADLVHDRFGF